MVPGSVRLTLWLTAWLCVVASGVQADDRNPCVTPRVTVNSTGAAAVLPAKTDTVNVASLNMAGQGRIADALTAWLEDRTVDVLLLQEVGQVSTDGRVFAAELAARLGFAFAFASSIPYENGHSQGLAILSRYPLEDVSVHPLTHFRLRFRSRCRIALAATVQAGNGALRLANVHLDTRINSGNRVAQLGPALEALGPFDGPRLIGGDFNTMNVRWLRSMWPLPYLQRQSGAVRTMMSSHGFDTPFTDTPATFRFLGLPLKLDWLYLKDLKPLEWGVDRIEFTDHRGVWAHLRRDDVEAGP